jgi:hypothetical protein
MSGAMAMSSGASSGTARLRELLVDNLETDTVCYRIDPHIADPTEKLLRRRQDKHYAPLLAWFEQAFGVRLATAEGFGDIEHPDEAYAVAEDMADGSNAWVKAALQTAVGNTKSTVIPLALVCRAIDAATALEASRVEEDFQISENGFVEDGHDTAILQARAALQSIVTFLSLLPPALRMPDAPLPPAPSNKNYAAVLAAAREERMQRVTVRRERLMALVKQKRALINRFTARLRQEAKEEEEKAALEAKAAEKKN